jgi:hypothetical protein
MNTKDYMEPKIDLPEFGREMIRFKNVPAKLDELQIRLAGFYAYYAEKMINLELKEAVFWEENKGTGETKKSDPMVRALWRISKDGKDKAEVDRTLKTIHILISSIKASLNRQTNEMRQLK